MTKVPNMKKKLLAEIADLPEEKLQEVIDFVGYLKAKVKEGKSKEVKIAWVR